MTRPRRTLATAGPLSEVTEAAEQVLAGQPLGVVHLRGCLEDPMWPTLGATDISELTGIVPDDVRELADQGWMPPACFIREGDRFAFRASAVAWAHSYMAVCLATGLMTVTSNEDGGVVADIDMVARPDQVNEARTWLARLTPELLHHSFIIEVLRPGGLALSKYEFEFAPPIAEAAEVWWRWLVALYENRSAQ